MDFTFLNNYDFSSAKIRLIPSVPGYHKQKENRLNLYGHKRLKYLLDCDNLNVNQNDNLIINIISIGSMTESYIID